MIPARPCLGRGGVSEFTGTDLGAGAAKELRCEGGGVIEAV